ncbi:MAG: hypothetical protein ACREFT_17090 [Acetobacteraceae bacterium]
MTDPVATILAVAFRHVINEANIEAGYERFRGLAGAALDEDAFHAGIAECLRRGLIREPIRLPEGALQCHWHLELTPAGVAAARSTAGAGDAESDI